MVSALETEYIVYDVESVVDDALLGRVLYRGQNLSPREALARYCDENARDGDPDSVFVPVSFHVPVSITVAKAGADFRLQGFACLDAPGFDPREMVRKFWLGLEVYKQARLVDFNGRGFDIPLLTLCAFRFGISCPPYFHDPDRFGFRYRFTSKHIDLMEWMTEYGAFRLKGGLNLLAKMLGKPGKMETSGGEVARLYAEGKTREINDYCLHDVLDTYFVFLRTRVLMGDISLEEEQSIVNDAKVYIEGEIENHPALAQYLDHFGHWNPEPFV